MSNLNICLVSGGDEIRLRSYVNHSIYSREFGLDYRLECGVDEGIDNKFFYKTSIIKRVLPKYDWILWIDDDAFFTDFSKNNVNALIEDAESNGNFLVIAEGPLEPNGFWSKINTGVFGLRNDPRSFALLDQMNSASLKIAEAWWDESKFGVFTGGDQDIFTWWFETHDEFAGVEIVSHRELNSRGHYYDNGLDDAFVMHFCGYPDKVWGVAKFAKKWGIGQELVPEHLLDKYSVRTRSPLSPIRFAILDQAVTAQSSIKAKLRPAYKAVQRRLKSNP
ncbi:hypothetical protein [Neomicrococcus lactis]|uniref:hypothetical protein n=1 Tax=Neomicrococcus lactis TaxID=732241 RepID=UPI0022FFF5E7|nr:hypothetical protein [Neomicrococcus lactis]